MLYSAILEGINSKKRKWKQYWGFQKWKQYWGLQGSEVQFWFRENLNWIIHGSDKAIKEWKIWEVDEPQHRQLTLWKENTLFQPPHIKKAINIGQLESHRSVHISKFSSSWDLLIKIRILSLLEHYSIEFYSSF